LVRELSFLIVDAAWDKQILSAGFHFPKEIIMKTGIGKFAVFALGVLTMGVFADHAQIVNQLEFKDVAAVYGREYHSGGGELHNLIRPVSGTDQAVVEISSASGKPTTMVDVQLVQPDAAQGGSHLVFNKYKNVLVLSQVFPGGGNQGYQLVEGHPEKLAAKTETPTKQTVASTAK
jgi:hypothetical protein